MAITPLRSEEQGFALLIAVIFMTVMLTFGLTLGALAYKQETLASSVVNAQYAFYAADSALECALYADQQLDTYAYPSKEPASAPSIVCDGTAPVSATIVSYTSSDWVVKTRLSLESGKRCADVTVYKYSSPQAPSNVTTYLFSQGYSVPCSSVGTNVRFVASGMEAHY